MSCGSVDDLIDAGEGEGILRASLVEAFEIDTQAPGFVLLICTITRFASQSGCLISLMNPASMSLASSSAMACRLASEKRPEYGVELLNPVLV